ncbi:hypothetical protein KM043_002586 [Ampulex compressa]|nr:hypothetical protein KM043_002586 [Ampulex compressa]
MNAMASMKQLVIIVLIASVFFVNGQLIDESFRDIIYTDNVLTIWHVPIKSWSGFPGLLKNVTKNVPNLG